MKLYPLRVVLVCLSLMLLVGCGGTVSKTIDQIRADSASAIEEDKLERYLDSLVTYQGNNLFRPQGHELRYKPLEVLIDERKRRAEVRGVERDNALDELGGVLILHTSDSNLIDAAYGSNYEVVVKTLNDEIVMRETGSDEIPSAAGYGFSSVTSIYTGDLEGLHRVEVISLLDEEVYIYEVDF